MKKKSFKHPFRIWISIQGVNPVLIYYLKPITYLIDKLIYGDIATCNELGYFLKLI